MTTEIPDAHPSPDATGPLALKSNEGLGAVSEARETCPACGDHAAYRVQRLECRSCGCTFGCDWDRAPSSPIADLLRQYANECSDFSGQKGYEFALMLARNFAERGPDSQMRCVVHTLLECLEAPNVRPTRPPQAVRRSAAERRLSEGLGVLVDEREEI